MTYELFSNFTPEPFYALEMSTAYNAAFAELQTAGDAFDPEALATVILVLEKTPHADAKSLARSAVEYMRA